MFDNGNKWHRSNERKRRFNEENENFRKEFYGNFYRSEPKEATPTWGPPTNPQRIKIKEGAHWKGKVSELTLRVIQPDNQIEFEIENFHTERFDLDFISPIWYRIETLNPRSTYKDIYKALFWYLIDNALFPWPVEELN